MEEIKLTIISEEEKDDIVNYQYKGNLDKNKNIDINEIRTEYQEWIENLIIFMHSCNYRKVLKEIEKKKEMFELLSVYELRKLKIIKSKAIFKIIRIKLRKYKLEIKKENHLKISSIEFWFNQIFFILEELINDFMPSEFDDEIDLDSVKLLKPIQSIMDIYLELIFLLIKFYYLRIGYDYQICSYLSILNYFIPHLSFITDIKSIYFLQNLFLLRAKIYFQNRNYLQSIEQQKIVFKLCLRVFILLNNFDNILLSNLSSSKNNKNNNYPKEIFNIFINCIIAFYFRGVTFEHLGYIENACQAYNQSRIIYMKYLIGEHEKFGIFINKIDDETRCCLAINNDIINIIKKRQAIKLKKRAMKKLRSSFIHFRNRSQYAKMAEKEEKYFYDKNNQSMINYYNNKPYEKIIRPRGVMRGIKNKYRKEKLEKYLSDIGNSLYIEEENTNDNLLDKYTKAKYILSTITMIDNLLSEDFQNILMKMDTIEITKPKYEIKSMIDKAILNKRAKLFNSKLRNKKRQNSALNLYRKYKNNILNDDNEFLNIKTNRPKNFNNNNIRKKLFFNRYSSNENNSEIFSSILIKPDKKQKNELNITQRMSEPSKYKNKKNKENKVKKISSVDIINNRIKSAIVRKKEKRKYFYNYDEIPRYPVDNKSFSKTQIRKKKYLDQYLKKEYSFQKQLLNSKRNEVKDLSEIDYYDQVNAYDSAEKRFDLILHVKKSNYNSKFISNLLTMKQLKINNESKQKKEIKYKSDGLTFLKIKKDIINAKYDKQKKRKGFTGISLRKFADKINEDDIKKLDIECIDLSFRMKKIENQRKSLILNIPKYRKLIKVN